METDGQGYSGLSSNVVIEVCLVSRRKKDERKMPDEGTYIGIMWNQLVFLN